jgi:hypothetical protein
MHYCMTAKVNSLNKVLLCLLVFAFGVAHSQGCQKRKVKMTNKKKHLRHNIRMYGNAEYSCGSDKMLDI